MMSISKLLTCVVMLAFALAAGSAIADKVTLDKPVATTGKKADKSKFAGRIVSYDEEGFHLKGKGDETETVAWSDLSAQTQYAVRRSLIGPKDAAAHVELGQTMLAVDGGKEWSEKAFALALKIDPKTKPDIEKAKEAAATPTTKPTDKPTVKITGGTGGGGEKPAMGENEEAAGPQMVGGVEKQFWGKLSDEDQKASVAELKAFADKTQETMKKSLQLNETNFFLFYSDLDKQEAKNWSGLLDRMYGMLAKMFGVDPKSNIWRGKALVFVFKSSSDYRRFQMTMHQTDPGTSIGMCHTYGSGYAHIAFYRQDKELEFAHVLVHEAVHGFIHRYRSPARVQSWVNEGLAEWIATQLLLDKNPNRPKTVRYNAQYWLRAYGGMHGFFDTDHIDGWQYPVAEMMTTMMIAENKKNYVAFVNGIKDGLTPEESLEQKFKAPRDKLITGLAKYLGVRIDG